MNYQPELRSTSNPQALWAKLSSGGEISQLPVYGTCPYCQCKDLATTFTGHVFCTRCAKEILSSPVFSAKPPEAKKAECPYCHSTDLAINRSGLVLCKNCGEEVEG